MDIGDKLKEAREEQNLSLEEIEKKSKIRKKYLIALEQEDFDVIPGEVYVKVFLKGYANQLGLEAQDLVSEYERWTNAEQERSKVQRVSSLNEEEEKDNDSGGRGFKITVIAIILIIISLFLINQFIITGSNLGLSSQSITVKEIEKEVPPETVDRNKKITPENIKEALGSGRDKKSEEGNVETSTPQPLTVSEENNSKENKPEAAADRAENSIRLQASEKSWILVKIDGELVYQGFIYKGEEMNYKDINNFYIKIGNGIAVTAIKDGEKLGPFGKRGEVVSKEIKFD